MPFSSQMSVVLVVWNGESYLPSCLRSLHAQTFRSFELVAVDNFSTDRSVDILNNLYPNVLLIQNKTNLGVAKGWNVGFAGYNSSSKIIVFLNQDVELAPNCLELFMEVFDRYHDVGVVGAKLMYPASNMIQHAGGTIDKITFHAEHRGRNQPDLRNFDDMVEVDYVTGACFAIRTSLLEDLKGADEWFSPAYYEDVDLCVRAKTLGASVIYAPMCVAYHDEHSSLRDQPYLRVLMKTRNRLRCVFKHVQPSILEVEFVNLEMQYFLDLKSDLEKRAFHTIYNSNWSTLPKEFGTNHIHLINRIITQLQQESAISYRQRPNE